MNMADGDTSSSSSSSSADEDDDDDGAIVAPSPPTATAPTAPTAPTATDPTTRAGDDASEEDDEALFEPTFASPSPIIGTTTTVGTVAGGTSSGGSYSSLTAETTALAVSAVAVSASGEKRKSKNNKKAANKKAKNNKPKPKPQTIKGSRTSPHEIDDVDDNSWQVSMLDIRRGEVDLQVEKWSSQKEQKSMELQLQQEKWRSESKQQNLEYKFDLMVKYKKLTEQGFDNHQIVKMIPDMRPIIDSANMPVHLQLSQGEQLSQEEKDVEE
jgi:hypothetical protein